MKKEEAPKTGTEPAKVEEKKVETSEVKKEEAPKTGTESAKVEEKPVVAVQQPADQVGTLDLTAALKNDSKEEDSRAMSPVEEVEKLQHITGELLELQKGVENAVKGK